MKPQLVEFSKSVGAFALGSVIAQITATSIGMVAQKHMLKTTLKAIDEIDCEKLGVKDQASLVEKIKTKIHKNLEEESSED